MLKEIENERRFGLRHIVSIAIRLEWQDEAGFAIVTEGNTENIGSRGTLVHLPRALPNVGSHVKLAFVEIDAAKNRSFEAEVLRLERNAAHPLAALQLTEAVDEWRERIWDGAAPKILAAEAELANELVE